MKVVVCVLQLSEDELRDAIVLVYANKQDLPNAMSVSDVQQALSLQEYRGRKVCEFDTVTICTSLVFLHQWYIQSTCATNGQGLLEGLDWLSAELAKVSSS